MEKFFHHRQQLARIKKLKEEADNINDRLLFQSIETSILDSKSHRTESNSMMTVQMNHSRYVKYMQRVVNEEQKMNTLLKIKKVMRGAVSQRRKLMRSGKSQLFYDRLKNDLIFIESYAAEIKNESRMARFFITHIDKIKRIAPPNWSNKLDQLYYESQLIINP